MVSPTPPPPYGPTYLGTAWCYDDVPPPPDEYEEDDPPLFRFPGLSPVFLRPLETLVTGGATTHLLTDKEHEEEHNSPVSTRTSSINKLAYDVFAEVIARARLQLPSHQRFKWIVGLASVSRRWRDTVLLTPSLWSTVHSMMTPRQVDLTLRRSNLAPLSIGSADIEIGINASGRHAVFLTMVSQHARRWEAFQGLLEWCIGETLASFTPLLRKLTLNLRDMRSGSPQFTLGEGAQLLELELVGVCMNWDSPRLRQLEVLSLCFLSGPHVPHVEELVQIISSSPTLGILRLENIQHQNGPGAVDGSTVPVQLHLANLRGLHLSKLHPCVYTQLISSIVSADCRCINLSSTSPIGMLPQTQWFDYSSPGFVKLVKPAVSEGSSICVDLGVSGPEGVGLVTECGGRGSFQDCLCRWETVPVKTRPLLSAWGPGCRLNVAREFPGTDSRRRCMLQIASLLKATCNKDKPILINVQPQRDRGANNDFPMDVLDEFSSLNVTRMRVRGGKEAENILKYLATPLPSGDWLFPRVKKLGIEEAPSDWDPAILRGWVEGRWAVLDTTDGADEFVEVTVQGWQGKSEMRKEHWGRAACRG